MTPKSPRSHGAWNDFRRLIERYIWDGFKPLNLSIFREEDHRIKMNRKYTFIILVISFFLFTSLSEQIGVNMNQINDAYFFSAATNPIALLFSPFFIFFLFNFKPKGIRETSGLVVPLYRRFAAFVIDFISALLPAASILALPTIIVEWQHTGTLAWQFTREFSRHSDTPLAFVTIIPAFVWMIFYFSYPLTTCKQTVGQYVLGFRIAANDKICVSFGEAVKRTIFSYLVLCFGWISVPLAFFNKQKHMLHDKPEGLRPELITYKNS